MTRIETIEMAAKTLVGGEEKIIGTNELQTLVEAAHSEDERDFYIAIYNYLLGKRQREVMADESY